MYKALLTSEQIQQLINSWKDSITGSEEQKLIEDLFLITGTPMPFKAGGTEQILIEQGLLFRIPPHLLQCFQALR